MILILVGLLVQLSTHKIPAHNTELSVVRRAIAPAETKPDHPTRQKQTRLTSTEITNLLDLRSQGVTILELSVRFDIHRTTVMAHIKRDSATEQP